jgi:hypothetical protein
MSYIGNQVTSVPFSTDVFSGTAAQTLFGPLLRSPATAASIMVFVAGVYQRPTLDYSISSGNYVSFVSAPASGTNNIVVHHIGNGVMATQVPVTSSVTTTSILDGAVRGNSIGVTAVTSNHITLGAITTNLIATGAISGNQLGLNSVSGNNIGTGAISANHFSGGGVTSETLSPNLTVSVSRTKETALVSSSGASGTINIDVTDRSVHYYDGTTSSNTTFNVRGNASYSFDSVTSIGQTTSVAAIVKNVSGTGRFVCFLTIDGSSPTIVYAANGKPGCTTTMIASTETNIFTWSILKTAASTYRVFASNTIFGTA